MIQKFLSDTVGCKSARKGDYTDEICCLLTLPPAEGTGPKWHRSGQDQSFPPSQAGPWRCRGLGRASIAHLFPLLQLPAGVTVAGQKLLQLTPMQGHLPLLSLGFASACSDLWTARYALNASAAHRCPAALQQHKDGIDLPFSMCSHMRDGCPNPQCSR